MKGVVEIPQGMPFIGWTFGKLSGVEVVIQRAVIIGNTVSLLTHHVTISGVFHKREQFVIVVGIKGVGDTGMLEV